MKNIQDRYSWKIPRQHLSRKPREQAVQMEVNRGFQEGCFGKGEKMKEGM